jgi:phenylpropionate dioxygenase-like ring-hydroxylating dioxygenase large terminal subunit
MADGQSALATRESDANLAEGIVQEAPHIFRVHTRAYTFSSIFQLEMKRIFERSWVFVAHESELPNPGDFKTSFIGLQPVIVTRGDQGEINVLVNRCVHRGTVICRELRGNAHQFDCPYHGWVYTKDGKLVGITDRREPGGYSEHFQAPKGLFRVPHVDSYRGFVFANFDPEAVPLLDHLGYAKTIIDRKLNQSPAGEIVFRSTPYVVRCKGNGKFQAENIVDGYHFLFVHKGFVQLQAKYGDSTGDFGVHKGGSTGEMRKIRYQGYSWGCPQGHGAAETPTPDPDALLNGPFGDYYRELLAQHGRDELSWIAGKGVASIFPNLGIIHEQIRVWRPIGPGEAEVTIYPYELKNVPAAYNEGMLRSQERFYGPAGHGMADDADVFTQNQQGLEGDAVEWLIMERGIDSDEPMPGGEYRGLPSSEAPQRGFWRQWQRLMNRH